MEGSDENPKYGKPNYNKPSYDKPNYDKPEYDKPNYDRAGEQGGDPLGNRDYRFKDSIQSGIRPNLPGDDSRKQDASALKNAEKNAANPTNPIADQSTAGSGNAAETAVPSAANTTNASSFANNVKGKDDDKGKIPLSKSALTKKMMKKFGPLGLVMGLIVAGALAIFGSQALLPFHVLEMFTDNFDSLQVGTNSRARSLTKHLLNDDTDPVKKKLIPFTGNKYKKLSKNRLNALAEEGIVFKNKGDVLADGTIATKRVIEFDDGTDQRRIVDVDDFDSTFSSDPNFRNGWLKGSRTWSGRIAGWFDSVIASFLKKTHLDRNLFKKWVNQVDEIDAGNKTRRAALQDQLKEGVSSIAESDTTANTSEEVTDDPDPNVDGDETSHTVHDADDPDYRNTSKSEAEANANLTTKAESIAKSTQEKLDSAASKMSIATMAVCIPALATMAISAIVMAGMLLQVIQYASTFAEAVDKTKNGQGDGAPLNEFGNILTESAPSHDGSKEMSAMESSSMLWATTGSSSANQNGASEQTFSLEAGTNILATIGKFDKEVMLGCAIAGGVLAAVSLVISFIPVAGQIYTGLKSIGKFLLNVAKSVVIDQAISLTIGMVVPLLAKIFMRDLVTDIMGEDVGNALAAGMHGYQSGNHKTGGGSAGTEAEVLAFRREQREVLAMQAELDRQTYSPFDITTKNTFLGSIFSKTLPFFGKSMGLFTILSAVGSTTASSVSPLLPTANAIDDVNFKSNLGDCPELESVGAVGDIFCQPYYISDTTTTSAAPEDIFRKVYASDWIATPRGGQSFTWGPKPSESRSSKQGRAVANSQGDNVDFAGEHWVSSSKRQHNFYLESDYCDDHYSSRTHHTSSTVDGETIYTITDYGQCLDRAATNSEDNVMLDRWTDGVEIDSAKYDEVGGTELIVSGSNLDSYIQFCSNRDTLLGHVDSNIVGNLRIIPQGTVMDIATAALGAVPYAGDIADIIDAADQSKALLDPWTDGRNCVAVSQDNSDHPAWNSELIYYQQYMEDARILEAQGATGNEEDSPTVGAFTPDGLEYPSPIFAKETFGASSVGTLLAKYEEAYPTDYSYEGRIAAITGFDKETVVAYMDLLNDYQSGKLDPVYIASLYPAPYGWGSEEQHSINELNTQKTVLARALKKFDHAKTLSLMTFNENRRRIIMDLV